MNDFVKPEFELEILRCTVCDEVFEFEKPTRLGLRLLKFYAETGKCPKCGAAKRLVPMLEGFKDSIKY